MNLLFLHPSPGLGWQRSYYEACLILEKTSNHRVVFIYNGPVIDDLEERVPVYHFDTWLKARRQVVMAKSINEIESEYPNSNLWLGVVSERLVANYSLLNGSFRTTAYPVEDLHFLVKALVLFYQWVFDREKIDAVLAHHPDNIHSTMLFEMCQSRQQVPFLLFPDYYWQQERYYLFDSKFFTSSLMQEYYNRLLSDYEKLVVPRKVEIASYLEARTDKDPSKVRADLLPKLTFWKNLCNGLDALRKRWKWITLRRPPIEEANYKMWLVSLSRAFVLRNLNLLQHKLGGRLFANQLPKEPFIYFPIQRVPEAAMLARATGYLNQQGFVQSISASLPAGYKLVIKDHPKSRGIHPLKFFREMEHLPNVVVMQDEFPNSEILQRTELVITIGGTLGLQQLMQGKQVLMFGRKFYELLAGVLRVENLNELPIRLKRILQGTEVVDAKEREKSLHAYVLTMLDFSYIAGGDAYSLHVQPHALASLVARMLDKEVINLVRQKKQRARSLESLQESPCEDRENVQRIYAGK